MKKILIYSIGLSLLCCSCLKSKTTSSCPYTLSTTVAPATEVATLQAYITANHPGAKKDSAGFFYQVTTTGTGQITPTVCNYITVTYTGTLTNGTVFDSNSTGLSSYLGTLIPGWQKGLSYIKGGGNITLYIPPTLGYGAQNIYDKNGVLLIPANSILIFNVQLNDVQ